MKGYELLLDLNDVVQITLPILMKGYEALFNELLLQHDGELPILMKGYEGAAQAGATSTITVTNPYEGL